MCLSNRPFWSAWRKENTSTYRQCFPNRCGLWLDFDCFCLDCCQTCCHWTLSHGWWSLQSSPFALLLFRLPDQVGKGVCASRTNKCSFPPLTSILVSVKTRELVLKADRLGFSSKGYLWTTTTLALAPGTSTTQEESSPIQFLFAWLK